jgi:hypothetical protein
MSAKAGKSPEVLWPDAEHSEAQPSIDFEYTDFGAARAVLEEPPAGVSATPRREKAEWSKRRRHPEATDVQLTPLALSWLERLPEKVRPHQLPRDYPRVANGIAEAWSDVDACLAMFAELLVDQRGNRRGFPAHVALELLALRDHRTAIQRPRR